MRRVLAPGGTIALSVWQALECNPAHKAINEATVRLLGTPALAVALSVSAQQLEALLSGASFQDIVITNISGRFLQRRCVATAMPSPPWRNALRKCST